MKEININIEGYNVNGICVGCLNYDRRMFYVDEVKECFKTLANIDVPDGLTIQVCWECLAAVRGVTMFQMQILKSYEVLIGYSKRHTFLNSPKDLTKYAKTRFAVTNVRHTNFEEIKDISDEKDVLKLNVDEIEDTDQKVKDELTEEDNFQNEFPGETEDPTEDIVDNGHVTSEDDISLKKIKEERDGREKKIRTKKKKKTKDLLGFKEVQLTEEEMWKLRKRDVLEEGFAKLKYKCVDCILCFKSKKLMEEHLNRKHKPKGSKSIQCEMCRAFFLTKEHLSRHALRHARGFACVNCDHVASVRGLAVSHSETHEGRSPRCSSCGDRFGTKSKLAYHKVTCQQERPQCVCCGKVFANKLTLKYHLKVLPAKTDKPKENVVIPCKGCSKVFYSKKSYRAHVVIHDGLQHHCQICNKPFQWKRNLARHMRNHRDRDNGSLHECKQCGKRFSSRDCYNNHMRFSKRHVAEEALSHECSYCGKKFATKWCMIDHVDWEHLERVKYRCAVCDKAFKTAKIMVAHMNNIHGGGGKREPDGAHLCDICGKSYKTDKRLKGHVWAMHTRRSTEKTHKCPQCPATFTWQTSIYKHMKMLHDRRGKVSTNQGPARAVTANQNAGVTSANGVTELQPNQPRPDKKESFEHLEVNNLAYYQSNMPVIQDVVVGNMMLTVPPQIMGS